MEKFLKNQVDFNALVVEQYFFKHFYRYNVFLLLSIWFCEFYVLYKCFIELKIRKMLELSFDKSFVGKKNVLNNKETLFSVEGSI